MNQFAHAARDSAYTVVGLGVLGFQRIQVRRQGLQRSLRDPNGPLAAQLGSARTELGRLSRELDRRLRPVATQVDEGLDLIQAALPEQAGKAVRWARQEADRARAGLVGRPTTG